MLWPHYYNNATRVITSHHSINPTAGLPYNAFSIQYDFYYHHYLHHYYNYDYCNHGTPCHYIIQLITQPPCYQTMKFWHYDSYYHHFYQFYDWLECWGKNLSKIDATTTVINVVIASSAYAGRITQKYTHSTKYATNKYCKT